MGSHWIDRLERDYEDLKKENQSIQKQLDTLEHTLREILEYTEQFGLHVGDELRHCYHLAKDGLEGKKEDLDA